MNEENLKLAENFVPGNYVGQGLQSLRQRQNAVRTLLTHRNLPETGWSDSTIEYVLQELAIMDSNNFETNVGVGEREGRIISSIVRRRHFGLAHGVGRSGDVGAVQPKAAGSSLIYQLTNILALQALREAGLQRLKSALVLPVATGMTMSLTMRAIAENRPEAKYVIWSRVDQKACVKAIYTAGMHPIVIDTIKSGDDDQLSTDVSSIGKTLSQYSISNILCVVTTTSCFAPRGCDKVDEVAKLCQEYDVPHVINNAYGVQSTKLTHNVNEAIRIGRVDAVVQSTDKNFCVPVGGAIVASPNKQGVDSVSKVYPGRASSSPIVDLFITLLSLGKTGWKQIRDSRKERFRYLKEQLQKTVEKHGERLLSSPDNPISMAFTLTAQPETRACTEFGSKLFHRGISGARVIAQGSSKEIGSLTFHNWGCNSSSYAYNYITCACALGLTADEIDTFCQRLDKALTNFKKDEI